MRRHTKRYWKRYNRKRYAEARKAVVVFLGGKCESCGADWLPFEIHHLNGGGGREWSSLPSFTRYKWIMDGTIPRADVSLLCLECHPMMDDALRSHPGRNLRKHQ